MKELKSPREFRPPLWIVLRLRLSRFFLPHGFAIWTWGDDPWDEPYAKKEQR